MQLQIAGLLLAAAVVLAVLAVMVIRFGGWFMADRDAKQLAQETITREDLRLQLQQQADESGFRVRLNTAPVSADGQIADWCVVNSVSNLYDMQVIVRTEDGTQIYDSGILSPGQELLIGELAQTLKKGSYPATAVAYALDRETGLTVGEVAVDITLTVRKTANKVITRNKGEQSL